MTRTSRLAVVTGCAVVVSAVALVNWWFLDELARIVRLPEPAFSADAHTHYLRSLHARDYFLPSGHHWGFDPFFYQGFVPFLLYPHLTYVVLAITSSISGIEMARVFNAYTVAIYLALPLIAGLTTRCARGALAGATVAIWLAQSSTVYGMGASGVFVVGLLSQQAGLCLFAALAYEIVLSRRIDRAALWLGLIPLVHVHAALLAAMVWLGEGAVRALGERPARELRPWLLGSVVAVMIAAPALLGIVVGWRDIGPATRFGHPDQLLGRLASGSLLVPRQTLLALGVMLVSVLVTAPRRLRLRAVVMLALGAVMVVVALQNLDGVGGVLGRTLNQVLRLRSLPFALVWLALVAAWGWQRAPVGVRVAVAVLTLSGLPVTWEQLDRVSTRVARVYPERNKHELRALLSLPMALRWVDRELGEQTATTALILPRAVRLGMPMRKAVEITGMPTLGGHGMELTSVHNRRLIANPALFSCGQLRGHLRRYSIGFVVGGDPTKREHYRRCLGRSPDFSSYDWWVYATGHGWATTPGAQGFSRNSTWTELRWRLIPVPIEHIVRLPIAASTRWSALVDGREVEPRVTADRMIEVRVPAGAQELVLRYGGPVGEWTSVAVSGVGVLILFLGLARRSGAAQWTLPRPRRSSAAAASRAPGRAAPFS